MGAEPGSTSHASGPSTTAPRESSEPKTESSSNFTSSVHTSNSKASNGSIKISKVPSLSGTVTVDHTVSMFIYDSAGPNHDYGDF
ncbi:hypothetical protein B0A55_13034, partial [Friedmanniomyces simplex]